MEGPVARGRATHFDETSNPLLGSGLGLTRHASPRNKGAVPYVIVGTRRKGSDRCSISTGSQSVSPYLSARCTILPQQASYTLSVDGKTFRQQHRPDLAERPDTDGDGVGDVQGKLTFPARPRRSGPNSTTPSSRVTDWRLPTIKELYSLILFSGV